MSERMEAPEGPEFDLLSAAAFENPYPIFDSLREVSPVIWHAGMNCWLVTGFAEAEEALASDAIETARGFTGKRRLEVAPEFRAVLEDIGTFTSRWILFLPAADHRQLRRLLNRGFRPGAIRNLSDRVVEIASGLADDFDGAPGPVDLVQTFTYHLPVFVIAELLGFPISDRPLLKAWSNAMLAFFNQGPSQKLENAEAMRAALHDMQTYLGDLVTDRRRQPQDDLISRLVHDVDDAGSTGNASDTSDAEQRLSDHDLIANCGLLLFAGHETTVNLIGNGMLAMLTSGEQWSQLTADPDLAPAAVTEALRYETSSPFAGRAAITDLELGGQRIAKGDSIRIALGAANRDPARFAKPNQFDLGRNDAGHVSFGWGIHYCLGARLAELEADVAFRTLAQRFPNMELAPDGARRRPGFALRGLERLSVTLNPPSVAS